jgi:hypothetical protein
MSPTDGGQDRYSADSWEQTRREARAADPPPRPGGASHSPATLVPGIVQMSLRGTDQDVELLVTAMRKMGIVVWRGNSPGTQDGNRAGYNYFSVEVPRDTRG